MATTPEKPYLETVKTIRGRAYNPKYGDDRICECSHPYYRHFDSYEDMHPVGCKYCECYTFKPLPTQVAEQDSQDVGYLILKVTSDSKTPCITDIEDADIQISYPGVSGVEIVERADATSYPGPGRGSG
jgi:hypothetical protein